jgi:hypothetical protein
MTTIKEMIRQANEDGYVDDNAEAKVCQDVVLKAISESTLSRNVTIKGGVVMRSISKDARRATQDMDIDFIRYSLGDDSIRQFIRRLDCLEGIHIQQIGEITELKQQDYHGKRVYVIISDDTGDSIESKIDLGVHKNLNIEQEEYCFDIACYDGSATLLINSKEQMITEILYLHRNHYEKQYAAIGGYPWGSAYLHYSVLAQMIDGRKVSEMTARELEELTGTRMRLPSHWQFHPKLGLLPKSFVDTRMVKKLFHGVKDYSTRLVKDYESFVTVSRDLGEEVEFSDIEIQDILSKMLLRDYQGKSVYKLDADEKGKLVVTLSKKYGISKDDIARVLHMPRHIVSQFVNSKDYGRAAGYTKTAKSV